MGSSPTTPTIEIDTETMVEARKLICEMLGEEKAQNIEYRLVGESEEKL